MPMIRYEGKSLKVDGVAAASADCCCGGGTGLCCDLGSAPVGTVTDKTGGASGMPDSIDFTSDVENAWVSETFASPCGSVPTSGITVSCESDVWTAAGSGGLSTLAIEVVSVDCVSLTVVLACSFDDGLGCSGTFTLTIQGSVPFMLVIPDE